MTLKDAIRSRRTRRISGILAALLALWAIVGFLVLPRLLRSTLERKLSEQLHRPVTLRGLSINPFALSATLDGLDVRDRGGAGPFFSLERLYVNLEARSLLRGGPVLRAVTLTKPSITLVRNADGTYNIQDLLDEAAKEKPSSKPMRFSLNNIRIERGSLDFDDRPMRTKHSVRDVTIGIPFLSNIPGQVEITTRPAFEAKVNGASFALQGKTKPFSQSRETTVELDLSDVDLPYYLSYVPPSIPWRLKSGRLDAKITIAFTQPQGGTPALVLSGSSGLRNLTVESAGRPLVACDRFEAAVDSYDVFGRKVRLRSLKAAGPEVWVRREKSGGFNFAAASASAPRERGKKAAAPKGKTAGASSPPMLVEVAAIGVEGGKVHYDDLSLGKPFRALVSDVAVSVQGYSTAPGKPATLEASAKTDAGETLKNKGTFSTEPLSLEGAVEIGSLPLKRYAPFYAPLVKFDVDDGLLDLATRYRFAAGPKGNTTLSDLTAALRSPRLRKRGEKKPFFRAPSVRLTATSVDLAKRDVTAGELSSAGGFLAVVRDKEGNTDVTRLMAEPPPGAPPASPSSPWSLALRKLALARYTIRVEDQAPGRLARYALTKTNLQLENFSTAPGAKAALSLQFGINGRGVASARGPVGIRPTYADLKADVKRLDLVPLEAYVLSNLRLSLARGTLSGAGRLSFREDPQGKPSVRFAGKVLIANALALDQATKLDFFKWDAFSAEGVKAGYNPTSLEMAHLGLSGVACDIVVEPDGTVNLAKVVGKPLPAEPEEEAPEQTAGAAPAAAAAATAPPPPAAPPGAQAAEEKVPIHIDRLTLEGGRIGLADHFVKPNYSATISDLAGTMNGLSTEQGTVARLDLKGRLADRSPLQITGTVNPLAATAFADVKASFRDIDLPPFTPYSGKYAGYAIARGTLTMEVAYKLQNRKLAAENKFLVDQFEFGQKVESKDATKLPVRLAVSLLKDRNGLIDLDLPIEGSLDDPKFRIGKIIWQVLGNLIAKAATAPFSLLGKLLGGKGEEMSSVDFADGRETLDEAAKKKLDALAKALNDRPALKLEATGRFSGDPDAQGLRRLLLERKVKAQKLPDLAKRGEAPASVDAIVVSESEWPTYLAKAYKREKFKKPRNVLGIAKTIPAAEMEKLMLENLSVTDSDLRQLALDRANAIKAYLTATGKVDAARVFVLEPAAKPAEPAGKARASRVDFTLK
jgi:uncharacterized protein involved in outer membrane biogenesis/outer membrane protein OmpA-like peptidoglycan-associated protein